MKIIPLGTSSGKPTLNRNVSATAVVAEGEWWLFDCGEATQMQMMRAGLSAHKLAGIFITHLHGDHFNGLPGLLSTMALDKRERELKLVGPPGIGEHLELLRSLRILFVNYPITLQELGLSYFKDRSHEVVFESSKYTITSRPLDHRIFALGYRVDEKTKPGRFDLEAARQLGIPEGPLYSQLQSGNSITLEDGRIIEASQVLGPPRPGKSVSYCLDTRPCQNAIELARDVDWLIYEATYTNDYTEEAHQYGHSTAAQAAQIAREAGARNLLITHFSSRYPDARPLLEEARSIFPDAVMAQDLIEIEVG
ncbi:MAG: ribonuclease Z [Acidobacteria bacterium]|nr:ribonuclease Z [Acidobacteriota bacterium]